MIRGKQEEFNNLEENTRKTRLQLQQLEDENLRRQGEFRLLMKIAIDAGVLDRNGQIVEQKDAVCDHVAEEDIKEEVNGDDSKDS